MHRLANLRLYESAIREMACRGHEIHMAFEDSADGAGWRSALNTLRVEYPTITCSWLSPPIATFWNGLAMTIRLWADYLRYLCPDYDSEPTRRTRAADLIPPGLVRLTNRPVFQRPANRRRLLAVLRAFEQALPPVQEIEQALRAWHPDVVLITPLIMLGSSQCAVLRTANAFGLRTAFCVTSWDNLSSKALIRDLPQRVLVWNNTQKDEAVRLHGIPPGRVVVTGAQCYDQWFDRQPSRDREAFCQHVGIAPDRPYVLYVCSSPGLLSDIQVEVRFVCQWLERLRTSEEPALREATVLIRPHPSRREQWNDVDLDGFERVQLYGSTPRDTTSKNDYFESLYYSRAVVGLNTSAFLEAAIVDRPVHTILLPEYYEYQEGTLHFRYLITVGGGLLETARSYDAHHRLLAASLRRPADTSNERGRFVTAFIRPQGITTPATSVFCDAIDEFLAAPAPPPRPTPWRYGLLRMMMWPVWQGLKCVYGAEIFSGRKQREMQRWRAAKERERHAQEREHRARKAATMVERATRRAEKAQRRRARIREKTSRVRRWRGHGMLLRLKRWIS